MLSNQCHQGVQWKLKYLHVGKGLHFYIHLISEEDGALVDDGTWTKYIQNKQIVLKNGLHFDLSFLNEVDWLDVLIDRQNQGLFVKRLLFQTQNDIE